MRDAGIDPPGVVIVDGRVHRFDVPGDGPKKKNGWYVLFDDPLAGAFGCWKRGIRETWHESKEFSPEEREAFKRRVFEERSARRIRDEKLKGECRNTAKRIWDGSKPCANHPYLTRKGISSHKARVHKGSLVVPVRNETGDLQGLQFIDDGGGKKFLTGTAKAGCYFSIGKPNGVVCIAEGFATAASIHECTGHAVAVAFDCGNLTPVGAALRAKFPDDVFIFCADNDISGIGLEKAQAAAAECKGIVTMPPVEGMDFNDYHAQFGADRVKEMFK
jgi:putative DNA primase/helicase